MDEARLAAVGRLVLHAHAACLEVLAVAARADFAVGVLPREPDLDVVGLRRAEAHVSGAEHYDAVGDFKELEHALGAVRHVLKLVVALLRRAELHHLDLVELVLAQHSAHVAAVAAGLAAEAVSVGAEVFRQLGLLERFARVEVRERHFGGRDEPEVVVRAAVEVLGELRKLARAGHRLRVDERRRLYLGEAVLRRVEVEHEVHKPALEPRARALEDGEAALGELDAAFEVHDAERLAELPVRLRLKIELARLAPAAHLYVVVLVLALRHARMRHVRQLERELVELVLYLGGFVVERLDFLAERADFVLERGRVLAGLFLDGDFLGAGVALLLQRLDAQQRLAALLVELLVSVERERVVARREHLRDFVVMVSDPLHIKHFILLLPSCFLSLSSASPFRAPRAPLRLPCCRPCCPRA